jgi:Domain of unknown function (DUF6487)
MSTFARGIKAQVGDTINSRFPERASPTHIHHRDRAAKIRLDTTEYDAGSPAHEKRVAIDPGDGVGSSSLRLSIPIASRPGGRGPVYRDSVRIVSLRLLSVPTTPLLGALRIESLTLRGEAINSLRKGHVMSQAVSRCPKCNGEMVQGFIVDFTHAARLVSQWAQGPPQKSFWAATKLPEEKLVPVGAFRCASCGYLESYARDEFAAQ